ncbi:MAG: hypothetical protein EOO21_02680 [Comamonadaceae bacterium]|nr:MAG: hypothetical protein EOO21_02680 [Comamonadaceae bacterium]
MELEAGQRHAQRKAAGQCGEELVGGNRPVGPLRAGLRGQARGWPGGEGDDELPAAHAALLPRRQTHRLVSFWQNAIFGQNARIQGLKESVP